MGLYSEINKPSESEKLRDNDREEIVNDDLIFSG